MSSRLTRHFAVAAAAAVVVTGASAGIQVFTLNQTVGATIDGLYINAETGVTYDGASADTVFPGWDLNPYGSSSMSFFWSGTANGASAGVRLNTTAGGTTSGTTLSSLPLGFVVGSSLIGGTSGASFGTGSASFTTTAQGKWTYNALNYFGFRFTTSSGATRYGWGSMQMGATATTRTIVTVAFEDSGGPIAVGDIGTGGTYDPCAPSNQSAVRGNNTLVYNANAADVNLGACSAGLTAFKANYYKFVPDFTGNCDISTCGGTADTVLAVSTSCSGGSILACNNDFCGVASKVTVNVTSGSTYYVVVGSGTAAGITGPVSLAITPWYQPCSTFNPTATTGSNSLAVNQTTAANLFVNGMNITKANYYKFTPTASGPWTFSTCATGAATRMAVLADCAPGASVLGSDDNGCGSSSKVTVDLTSGVPVYLVVGGEGADIPSPIGVVVAGPPIPACAQAIDLAYGDNVFDSSTNNGAQLVQNSAAGTTNATINQSVWFKFVPTATGAFSFQTCGASGTYTDTMLAIGSACPSVGSRFDTLAFSDDAPCPAGSTTTSNKSFINATNNGATGTFAGFPLTQNLVRGQTYYICVGSYSATSVVSGSLFVDGPQGTSCPADLNNNGVVDGADLGLLLGNWGNPGIGDINNDGIVNGADLGTLLGAFGPCI